MTLLALSTVYFCLFSSALAWLAGVVSLNDLRLSANMPRDNFGATVASDGKRKRVIILKMLKVNWILKENWYM